jgi:peptide deformylase
MKKINLKTYPDSSLTTPAKKWDFSRPKDELLSTIKQMEEILENHPDGVALAANQAGFKEQIFIIDSETASKWDIPKVFINPRIHGVEEGPSKEEKEGCLSFPGIFVNIRRYDIVSCDYEDEDGIKKAIIVEGFPARVFQHECDHLKGKLMIDHLPRILKYQIIGEMRNRKG